MKYFFAILTSYLLFACTTVPETPQDAVAVFENALYESTLTPEKLGNNLNTIQRWEDDILYYVEIDDDVKNVDRDEIYARIRTIDQLLPISFTETDKDNPEANLAILLANEENFTIEGTGLVSCMAMFEAGKDGKINTAVIALPGKNLDIAYLCTHHELMHAIGFSSHVRGAPSTLTAAAYEWNFRTTLTIWDYIFIETLYSADLSAGMTRAEAAPIIQKLIENEFPAPAL